MFQCGQGDIKRDPDGYSDEFKLQVSSTAAHYAFPDQPGVVSAEWAPLLLQYRHYQASLDVFNLKPSKESREFAELVTFVAQVGAYLPVAALRLTSTAPGGPL